MLARFIGVFERSRLLQLFIVTACIQGGVIISQFLIAPFVEPSVVGTVRSLETVIALVVLAGSLGMQSIVVRDTAACSELHDQNAVLRQVFTLVFLTSALVMLAVGGVTEFVMDSQVATYVFMACGLTLFTNLLRVSTGFAQGVKSVKEIYLALGIVTGGGVVLHVVLTDVYGIEGWVIARYVTEVACLMAVWWQLRHRVAPALRMLCCRPHELLAMGFSGVTVNASLFARLLVNSLPVLMLTAMHAEPEDIGFFGLAILSLVLGMLPLAIIAQKAIPDLVEVLQDPATLIRQYKAFLKSMTRVALAVTAMLLVLSVVWLVLVGGQYEKAARYTAVLAFTLPFRALALACNTMLVSLRMFGIGLKTNLFEGVLAVIILYVGINQFSGWAGVVACMAGSLLNYLMLSWAVNTRLRELRSQHAVETD